MHAPPRLPGIAVLAVATLLPIAATADTIHVPGDQPTIQAGIDAAVPGDQVLVAPGTYHETITLAGGVDVVGAGGASQTTIVGYDPDMVVIGADEARIAGFRLTGSYVGLACGYQGTMPTSPIIEDNIIECVEGVFCHIPYQQGPTMPVIRHNIIRSSYTGVYMFEQAAASGGVNAIIASNTFYGCDAAIHYRTHMALPTVERNIIVDCNYGIYITYCSLFDQRIALISCNDVWHNTHNYWVDAAGCGPFELTGVQGNFSTNPLFCAPLSGDFNLQEGSPCLPEHSGGCGLVGALPAGCGGTAVEPSTWGAIKASFR